MAEPPKYPSISFFCPAHNEEENLPVLIPAAHAYFSRITDRFEILIIENGSTDATPKIADDLAKKYSGVRVLHYEKGLGYGGALREGFAHCQHEYVCYTDADNQYDVREFEAGFELLKDADIASGFVTRKAVSFGRRFQSTLWNLMVLSLFFIKIRDINCSMKIFKRRVLDAIKIESASAFIDAEMLVKSSHAGFKIKQFPVTHYERTSGKAIGSSRNVITSTIADALSFWYQTYRPQIWIFAGALAVRTIYALVVLVKAGQGGFIAYSDAEFFYYRLGINLIDHHVFSLAHDAPWYPNAYHTPLYPLLLAVAFFLKPPLFTIALLQGLLAAVSAVFAYKIARSVSHSSTIALVAGLLCAFEPMSIYWGGLLMSDAVFSLLTVISLYLLLKERYLASAILLGFAALTRPIALLFLPAFACYAAYRHYLRHGIRTGAFKVAILIIVAFAVVVSPWFVRNKIVFGVWEYTSAGWYDLYVTPVTQFALSHDIALKDVPAIEADRGTGFHRFDFLYSRDFKKAVFSAISQDPYGFVAFQIKRAAYAVFSNRYDYLVHEVIGKYVKAPALAPLLELFIAAGGVFWFVVLALGLLAVRNKDTIALWLLTAYLVGVNAGISGGINPGGTDMSRYELPFQVLLFTFAGIGATMCIRWLKTKRFP